MTSLRIPVSTREVVRESHHPRGLTTQWPLAVERRLDAAERELRVQFTRIAQLQAEVDLLSATLRHLTDADAMSLTAEHVLFNRGLERRAV